MRQVELSAARPIAERCLTMTTGQAVRDLVAEHLEQIGARRAPGEDRWLSHRSVRSYGR